MSIDKLRCARCGRPLATDDDLRDDDTPQVGDDDLCWSLFYRGEVCDSEHRHTRNGIVVTITAPPGTSSDELAQDNAELVGIIDRLCRAISGGGIDPDSVRVRISDVVRVSANHAENNDET